MLSKLLKKKVYLYRIKKIKYFIFLFLISFLYQPAYASKEEYIIKNFSILLVLISSCLYLKYIYRGGKLLHFYQEYIISLKEILNLYNQKNKPSLNNIQEILDKISFNGISFLIYLFKFLIPYFTCLSIFLILKLTSYIGLIIMLPSIPYLILIFKK